MTRGELPIVSSNGDNLCKSCNGACCRRGTILDLTDEGRDFLIEGGAKLENTGLPTRAEKEAQLRERLGALADGVFAFVTDAPENPRYIMLEDCPYLDSSDGFSACTVYDNPRKPEICSSFPAGSSQCLLIRDIRYLHTKSWDEVAQ